MSPRLYPTQTEGELSSRIPELYPSYNNNVTSVRWRSAFTGNTTTQKTHLSTKHRCKQHGMWAVLMFLLTVPEHLSESQELICSAGERFQRVSGHRFVPPSPANLSLFLSLRSCLSSTSQTSRRVAWIAHLYLSLLLLLTQPQLTWVHQKHARWPSAKTILLYILTLRLYSLQVAAYIIAYTTILHNYNTHGNLVNMPTVTDTADSDCRHSPNLRGSSFLKSRQ